MGKRIFPSIGLLGCMVVLLLYSSQSAQAVRDALRLCAQSVVPALFPFFVLSDLFLSLSYADVVGGLFSLPLRRLVGCSDTGATAFFLGCIGGYPLGGRTVGQLYRSGQCSKDEAIHLLSFCNNAGPAFIIGIAGNGCFHSLRSGIWLYLIHVTAALPVGMLLGRGHFHTGTKPTAAPPSLPAAFVQSVRSGAMTMVQICGFVVFFQVVLHLFSGLTGWQHPLLLGSIELTCGILSLPPTCTGFVCCAALLGWGGLSVHCQTAAVLHDTDLPMRRYLLGKLLHAGLSAMLAIPMAHWLFP